MDKEMNGDSDSRIALFTKRFGKLTPKARSLRKITSKLSGHLEPGNLVLARLVEKNGLQVVDALKTSRVSVNPPDLYFLGRILAEAEPEPILWQLLSSGSFNWREILKILGWDPNEAICAICHKGMVAAFAVGSQEFFCEECVSKLEEKEVILIGHADG